MDLAPGRAGALVRALGFLGARTTGEELPPSVFRASGVEVCTSREQSISRRLHFLWEGEIGDGL